jgi:glycerol-3-phosphate dehydrogenase
MRTRCRRHRALVDPREPLLKHSAAASAPRATRRSSKGRHHCDVLVVGGGINGCGIARDLAGRGANVVLCEKDDLASHTSSSSTKLIHGGLRYLEYYEFSLVRKALAEREVLLKSAPHIMRPLRFVMPHDPNSDFVRPVWMIRLGLFLYDHLARREVLPGSRAVNLHSHPAGAPLKREFSRGFVYSDGWVDDARLVVLNAIDAAEHGATILTRTRCTAAHRSKSLWHAQLQGEGGQTCELSARALVNAAGPWAGQFLREQVALPRAKSLRLVKGSHVVVRKLFDHEHAYIFQNPDKRIIFAIPYEGDFTLIGTTDVEHLGAPGDARIDDSEVQYLCAQASRYFARPVVPGDVVWSYCGVRPLLDDDTADASAVTRDYLLELDDHAAPLLSVWGGKITTFRKLAEEAADALAVAMRASDGASRLRGAWTEGTYLPGGDLSAWIGAAVRPDADIARFAQALAERHPQLSPALVQRYARCYGARVDRLLGDGTLGAQVAPSLYEAELHYLREHEWARSPDDVLWRRTKLGLHLSAAERKAVAQWWDAQPRVAEPRATSLEATWN